MFDAGTWYNRCATFGLEPPTISVRAARNQPHRELDAFRTCLPDIFYVRHLREALVAVN